MADSILGLPTGGDTYHRDRSFVPKLTVVMAGGEVAAAEHGRPPRRNVNDVEM